MFDGTNALKRAVTFSGLCSLSMSKAPFSSKLKQSSHAAASEGGMAFRTAMNVLQPIRQLAIANPIAKERPCRDGDRRQVSYRVILSIECRNTRNWIRDCSARRQPPGGEEKRDIRCIQSSLTRQRKFDAVEFD